MPIRCALYFVFCVQVLNAQIILTEIMFNPSGSERTDEFIELYNLSRDDTVDLHGWLVSDSSGYNRILAHSAGTRLAPRSFAVIFVANYYLQSNYYAPRVPAGALPLTIDKTMFGSYGLNNSRSEAVSLHRPDSSLACRHAYTVPNEEGLSEEKIILAADDRPSNWRDSVVRDGTPGAVNSVSPAGIDAGIAPGSLEIAPPGFVRGQRVQVGCRIENAGSDTLHRVEVAITATAAEGREVPLCAHTLERLDPGAFTAVACDWPEAMGGRFALCVCCNAAGDQRPDNDALCRDYTAGYSGAALVINEIMYSPAEGEPEWIELYNPGAEEVDLCDWSVSDADTLDRSIIADEPLRLPAGGYVVVAAMGAVTLAAADGLLLQAPGRPSLSNSGDRVRLYDAEGRVIDEAAYAPAMGGAIGRSLERLSPQQSSATPGNWSTCVDELGHTAGGRNSLFFATLPPRARLQLDPIPFSPDGDGHEDHLAIGWTLPAMTALVNVRIFDRYGRLVRLLCSYEPSGSSRTIFWDGRDAAGQRCRIGFYIVHLEAFDERMGKFMQEKAVCVVAGRL